jgi:hypothetical protein
MKTKLIYIIPLLALVVMNYSCRKENGDITPTKDVERQAYIQWFNGTLNSTRNFIYVNGVQINGNTNSFGSLFPSSSYAFAVYSGSSGILIKDTLSTSTQVAQNFVQTLNTQQSYSIFTYDTITSPKRLIVENANFVYPNDNKARVRFLNIIYNPTPPPAVDIFSVNSNSTIATGISVAQLTNFLLFDPGVADTWQVRQTGTTTVMASFSLSSTSLIKKRFYTFVYRGSHRAAGNRGVTLIANN